jgi:methionyl-tRNA synthetase
VLDTTDQGLIDTASELRQRVEVALERLAPNEALAAIWVFVAAANKYVAEVQPWALAKRRAEGALAEDRLATTLYNLVEALRLVAQAAAPLLPETAAAIAHQLGIAHDTCGKWTVALSWGGYPPGTVVRPGNVLFPKLELAEV